VEFGNEKEFITIQEEKKKSEKAKTVAGIFITEKSKIERKEW